MSDATINPGCTPPRFLKWIWLGTVGLALFVLTMVVGNAFVAPERRVGASMVGHDFLAFYTAGSFVAEGRSRELYDLEKVKAFQHDLAKREGLEIGASFGPFWNPPFYAWVFAPLSRLPYGRALAVWEMINGAALVAALWLLVRIARHVHVPADDADWLEDLWEEDESIEGHNAGAKTSAGSQCHSAGTSAGSRCHGWRCLALIPLLVIFSMPAIQAMTHGQNTMISLLLLCGSVALWQKGHRGWAGAVAGLLFYKPQLGAIFAAALVLIGGRRAVLGLAITGVWLLAINLLTLPGSINDYLRLMPGNLRQFQVDNVYLWDRHVTLRAFWRLLIQGREPGEMWLITKALWLISCAGIACGLLWAWKRTRGGGQSDAERAVRRDWFVASGILAMPLLMPFYFDYDLLLISTGAVLSLRAAMAGGGRHGRLVLAWAALFAATFFNSPLARTTHVGLTVVLLVTVQFMTTSRAIRGAGTSAGRADNSGAGVGDPLAAAA